MQPEKQSTIIDLFKKYKGYILTLFFIIITLYPSAKTQSHMRKTVSAGRTSAKIQINHLLAITAYGRPLEKQIR